MDNNENFENNDMNNENNNLENLSSKINDAIYDSNTTDNDTNSAENNQHIAENRILKLNNEIINKDNKYKKLKRKNLILTVLVAVFILIFIAAGTFLFIVVDSSNIQFNIIKNRLSKNDTATDSNLTGELDYNFIVDKLTFIDQYVNYFYYYTKDNKKIEDAMFSGYIKALGDKYGEYMPAKTYDNFVEETSGEYYGIGCQVKTNPETNENIVDKVFENSPAKEAGIIEGDVFKKIEGVDVSNKTLQEIVDMVKGEENTYVNITFYRDSIKDNIDIKCRRGKVEVQRVDYQILEDNIGYIQINEFTGKTETQFKNTVDQLLEKEAKGFIIDLRNNPGGELMTVLNMLDYVLKDNDGKFTLNQDVFTPGNTLLVYMRDKETIVDEYYCDDKHDVHLPIVILINENSASASELFTQCLKDYGLAKVVGKRSYGKGVMQNVQPLPDGSAIRLTVAGYFPPSGYEIDGNGVIPDIPIESDGSELFYDNDGNEFYFDANKKITLLKNGEEKVEILSTVSNANKDNSDANVSTVSIAKEKIATNSIINENDSVNDKQLLDIINSKKPSNDIAIYDNNFKYQNEDWFIELDEKYEDKVLLQGLLILKE